MRRPEIPAPACLAALVGAVTLAPLAAADGFSRTVTSTPRSNLVLRVTLGSAPDRAPVWDSIPEAGDCETGGLGIGSFTSSACFWNPGGQGRFGRRDFVWLPEDGIFPTEVAVQTWNLLMYLVSTSCAGEDDDVCFQPGQALRADGCSFNAPHLCEEVQDFVFPFRVFEDLGIERARVKAKRKPRVRVRGRYAAEGVDLEQGAVTVLLGDFVQSIPLAEFREKGDTLRWKGRLDGLRRIKLHRDGRFLVVARGLDVEGAEADALPFLLQVGDTLGGARIPLP